MDFDMGQTENILRSQAVPPQSAMLLACLVTVALLP